MKPTETFYIKNYNKAEIFACKSQTTIRGFKMCVEMSDQVSANCVGRCTVSVSLPTCKSILSLYAVVIW